MLFFHGDLPLRALLMQLASLTVAGGDLSLVCQATIGSIDAIMETFMLEKVPGTPYSVQILEIFCSRRNICEPQAPQDIIHNNKMKLILYMVDPS